MPPFVNEKPGNTLREHSPGTVPTAGAPGTVPGYMVAGMLAFVFLGPKRKFAQGPTLKRGLIAVRSRLFTRQARTLCAQATEAFKSSSSALATSIAWPIETTRQSGHKVLSCRTTQL